METSHAVNQNSWCTVGIIFLGPGNTVESQNKGCIGDNNKFCYFVLYGEIVLFSRF